MILLALSLGCSDHVEPSRLASPVDLDTSLVRAKVGQGEPLVLRACVRTSEPGWSWSPAFPEVEGLQAGEIQTQVEGQVSCLERPYQGEPGPYALGPVQLQAAGPAGATLELSGPTLYGDIGEPLASSDLGALAAQPDRRWIKAEVPWARIWAGLLVLVLGGVGALWLRRRGSPGPSHAVPALPPGEQALRDWALARDDRGLSDQEKGQALSRITRRYLTHLGAPQALMRTSEELLAELRAHPELHEWCGVLEQLLRAADTVKFAGGVASAELLRQWTEGLSSLVQAHQAAPPPEQV